MRRHCARGFTLIELMVAASAAAVLTLLAWPSMQGQLVKARRADATAALQQLQMAQERHHALHGLYAADLGRLGSASAGLSPQGLYRIELQPGPGDAYTAVARARSDGAQAGDGDCPALTLHVDQGLASLGPRRRCWNR